MTYTVDVHTEDEVHIVIRPFSITIERLGKEDHETRTHSDIQLVQPKLKDGKLSNTISIFGQILGVLVRIWFWLWPRK